MPIYQVKASSPITFTSEAGVSFVKNPKIEFMPDPTFSTDNCGSGWSCLGATINNGLGQLTFGDQFQSATLTSTPSGIQTNTTYDVTIDVAQVASAGNIQVEIGGQFAIFTYPQSLGATTLQLTTDGSLTAPQIARQFGAGGVAILNGFSVQSTGTEETATAVTHTPQTISPADLPAYDMTWAVDPVADDIGRQGTLHC